MEKTTIKIGSSNGNNFAIEFSPLNREYFAEKTWQLISGKVDVVNIDLVRIMGESKATLPTLSEISQSIANFFMSKGNIILCYYCDFLSVIPNSNKPITCQEYRSRLFSDLFYRYVNKYHIGDVSLHVIRIESVETHYVHLIYRNELSSLEETISNDIKDTYNKP
jgi:hypothetical protein